MGKFLIFLSDPAEISFPGVVYEKRLHTSWKFQLVITSNTKVIAKKPLTNLYEMNSTYCIVARMVKLSWLNHNKLQSILLKIHVTWNALHTCIHIVLHERQNLIREDPSKARRSNSRVKIAGSVWVCSWVVMLCTTLLMSPAPV